ncbi:unnamed protein product [Kuraishia capsulata CBS 1993]|uniref:SP-RING-type domain-containing protein n=1 Tax=Kuraishia capsulata CBS 1993 TaxID=1382522 RepID=W6MT56_9ASCO|nr:uncharacterized protein KUCA_T00000912001 [Kuraishia capsulata CBS 1993]CDK24945.1 unnamed protein product [Kuraishia capsulata CBS 1993]
MRFFRKCHKKFHQLTPPLQELNKVMNSLKVAQLKNVCRSFGLTMTGKKAELVDKLAFFVNDTHNLDPQEYALKLIMVKNVFMYAEMDIPDIPSLAWLRTLLYEGTRKIRPDNLAIVPANEVPSSNIYGGSNAAADVHPGSNQISVRKTTSSGQRYHIYFTQSPFFKLSKLMCPPISLDRLSKNRMHQRIDLMVTEADFLGIQSQQYKIFFYSGEVLPNVMVRDSAAVEYPGHFAIHVNGTDVTTTIGGLKNKVGTFKPADLTKGIKQGHNDISYYYGATSKRYLFYIHKVEVLPFDVVAKQVIDRPHISKLADLQILKGDDEDDDDLIIEGAEIVTLKCPITMAKMKVPAKSIKCNHLACFDLTSFLQLQFQSPRWNCTVCGSPITFNDLAVDDFFKEIAASTDEDTEFIELERDGSWRPKKEEIKAEASKEEIHKEQLVDVKPQTKPPFLTLASASSPSRESQQPRDVIVILSDSDDDEPEPLPIPPRSNQPRGQKRQAESEPNSGDNSDTSFQFEDAGLADLFESDLSSDENSESLAQMMSRHSGEVTQDQEDSIVVPSHTHAMRVDSESPVQTPDVQVSSDQISSLNALQAPQAQAVSDPTRPEVSGSLDPQPQTQLEALVPADLIATDEITMTDSGLETEPTQKNTEPSTTVQRESSDSPTTAVSSPGQFFSPSRSQNELHTQLQPGVVSESATRSGSNIRPLSSSGFRNASASPLPPPPYPPPSSLAERRLPMNNHGLPTSVKRSHSSMEVENNKIRRIGEIQIPSWIHSLHHSSQDQGHSSNGTDGYSGEPLQNRRDVVAQTSRPVPNTNMDSPFTVEQVYQVVPPASSNPLGLCREAIGLREEWMSKQRSTLHPLGQIGPQTEEGLQKAINRTSEPAFEAAAAAAADVSLPTPPPREPDTQTAHAAQQVLPKAVNPWLSAFPNFMKGDAFLMRDDESNGNEEVTTTNGETDGTKGQKQGMPELSASSSMETPLFLTESDTPLHKPEQPEAIPETRVTIPSWSSQNVLRVLPNPENLNVANIDDED